MSSLALVSIVVLAWGWWSRSTSLDVFYVGDGEHWGSCAFTLASSILIKPLHSVPVGTPVADSHGHTSTDIVLHLFEIVSATAIRGHRVGLSILGERDGETGISTPLNLCAELLLGVNCILASWTVDSVELLEGNLEA